MAAARERDPACAARALAALDACFGGKILRGDVSAMDVAELRASAAAILDATAMLHAILDDVGQALDELNGIEQVAALRVLVSNPLAKRGDA